MKTASILIALQFLFISSISAEVKANYNDNRVEISWDNPNHVQIAYFVIERSKNGRYFKEILKVEATKSDNGSVEYYEVDYKPFNKKAYYRIKQVDVDGNRYYSNVILAKNTNNVKPLFGLFSSTNNKNLKNYNEKDLLVVLVDVHQNEFIAKVDVIKEGKQLIATHANITLPTGEYLITATSDDKLYGKKIQVNGNYSKPVYTQNIKQP